MKLHIQNTDHKGCCVFARMSVTHCNLLQAVISFIAAQGKICHLYLKHLDMRKKDLAKVNNLRCLTEMPTILEKIIKHSNKMLLTLYNYNFETIMYCTEHLPDRCFELLCRTPDCTMTTTSGKSLIF